jgi:hypothetical protein
MCVCVWGGGDGRRRALPMCVYKQGMFVRVVRKGGVKIAETRRDGGGECTAHMCGSQDCR